MDILQTLSLARTALDDPGAFEVWEDMDNVRFANATDQMAFAIDMIDQVMYALDVELHPALALTTMGKLIAEIGNQLEAEEDGGTGVNVDLADMLYATLNSIDRVIDALDRKGHERHP